MVRGMGWFLKPQATSKRKRGSNKRGKTGKGRYDWDPQRTMVGVKLLAGVAVVVGAVLGWRYGERALLDYAASAHGGAVTAEHVELADAPVWMGRGVQEQVRLTAASRISPDPMNGRSLRIAVMALEQDPWVERVRQVRRQADGRVLVEADYRRPVALVATRDGYRLTDAAGVVLPGLYLQHQVARVGLPVISGVSERTPAAGEAWLSEDVYAGLALVQTLAGEPYADQILRYDVSHRDARGRVRLVLYTQDGMVRWGLPPGMEQAIEPDADVKRSWLRHVAQTRGAIDAGGKVVDVYGARIAVYQPSR